MQTQTVEQFYFNVRSRLNAGSPSLKVAMLGAIREAGPLRTARVSSAQAKGAGKNYAYWGAVRYQLRITRDGQLANLAWERASSDRRTIAGAERDCEALCENEGRLLEGVIGGVLPEHIAVKLGLATSLELRAVAAIQWAFSPNMI